MECSDYAYSENENDFFQPTTNEASFIEMPGETKYNKWINSNSELSRISNIYKAEKDNISDKIGEFVDDNKNDINEKFEKEMGEEENLGIDDYSENGSEGKSEEEETFEDSNNVRKNYVFIWDEGGNEVKITGSFSDWKILYPMIKDSKDNLFKCELSLNSETYQYKFIVDGEWKYSKKYPIQADGNGNINNVLDNTKNNILVVNSNKKKKKKKEKKKPKKNKTERKTSTKTRATTVTKEGTKIYKNDSIYQSDFSSIEGKVPPPLPNERYFESFQFDNFSKQNSIGNNKYYDYYTRFCFSNEASSKPIFELGHINLDHLISNNNKESFMNKNSMSFRYREKACTFIYYKYNYK